MSLKSLNLFLSCSSQPHMLKVSHPAIQSLLKVDIGTPKLVLSGYVSSLVAFDRLPLRFGRARVVFPRPGSSWFWEAWKRRSYRPLPGTLACAAPRLYGVDSRVCVLLTSIGTYIACAVPFMVQIQPIPLGVTFSKAQSSKLERLFCHGWVKRGVRTLSFEPWNSIRNCHSKWDWLYILGQSCAGTISDMIPYPFGTPMVYGTRMVWYLVRFLWYHMVMVP